MKKLFLIGIALMAALTMSAQKQMMSSAWSYLKDGYLDDAKKAMDQLSKLRGCEVHSTVILSAIDERIFKRLGVNLTCEPKFGKPEALIEESK